MKKSILFAGMLAMIAFTACNSAKTDETKTDAATVPSGPPVTVDLENKGVDGLQLTLSVPDSIAKKLTFAKSEYTGAMDILAGDNFKMRIYSNMADADLPIDSSMAPVMETMKYNNDPSSCKHIINEPRLFMWSTVNLEDVTCYHFFATYEDPKDKSTYYSFEDISGVAHSEATIRSMIEITKSLKRK